MKIYNNQENMKNDQVAWLKKFEYLVQFRDEFPHRWPKATEEFPKGNKVGYWINRQRAVARSRAIDPYRLKMLEEINFPIAPFDERWNCQYNFLKHFILSKNRSPRKREEFPKDNKLGIWCQVQRDSFKSNSMQKEKIELLNDLGFEWNPIMGLWYQQFKSLKRFKVLFPDRWPAQREEYPNGNKLGQWCQTQRNSFEGDRLSARRKNELDQIGFFTS